MSDQKKQAQNQQLNIELPEELAEGVYEVEFSDNNGVTYASVALKAEQLMILHYQPLKAS